MWRHVLAVYVRFDTSLFSLGVTDLNYILKIIESEFVSKRLCIETTELRLSFTKRYQIAWHSPFKQISKLIMIKSNSCKKILTRNLFYSDDK